MTTYLSTNENDTVDDLLLRHLDAAALPDSAKDLVLGALYGEEDLQAVLGGATPTRRPPTSDAKAAAAVGTYLTSIEVTGFRGIGPTATLGLVPGPGLTIVTGHNGCGKSSFAEAAELALTGDNRRWAGRSAIWRDGWRNLHATDSTVIRVGLTMADGRDAATVECHWKDGAGLADRTAFLQPAGRHRQEISELGWDNALALYRPFLSYAELGDLLTGKPSEIHDSLQGVLGLARLVEVEKLLKAARREADLERKLAGDHLPALLAALNEHPDPRARQAERAFAGGVTDLELLERLATADQSTDDTMSLPVRQLATLHLPTRDELAACVARLRDALRQIDDLAGTPAGEARALAGLLGEALRHHRDHPAQPCPVCGGSDLDDTWAERTTAHLQRLTQQAERLEDAHRAEQRARRALRDHVPSLPSMLTGDLTAAGLDVAEARQAWQRWDELLTSREAREIADEAVAAFDVLDTALEPVQAAARQHLERRQRAWQPVAKQLRGWVTTARTSRQANLTYAALQKAVTWLHATGKRIRNDTLAPVAAEATGIWNTLRQESSVDLGAIALTGAGAARRVDVNVTVDGEAGAALGVMSQGELHALALALFLPRATMPQSPFRFLVIDDPVQSMDPTKVRGLAEVLEQVARHRQVIVFTHDDRLPTAIRHLNLNAHIHTVTRHPRSHLTVTTAR